jgi:nucleoid DNA-binding protein
MGRSPGKPCPAETQRSALLRITSPFALSELVQVGDCSQALVSMVRFSLLLPAAAPPSGAPGGALAHLPLTLRVPGHQHPHPAAQFPKSGERSDAVWPSIMRKHPLLHSMASSIRTATRDQHPDPGRRPPRNKHEIALALMERGCTWRQAHKAVDLFFQSIKMALSRHETVDLPFGTFSVIPVPQRRHRRWRLGQPQEVFRRRFRVLFTPREL